MKHAKWGENYEFAGPNDWHRNSLIVSEVTRLLKRGLLLDFGCGTSMLLARLANFGFSGIGIDRSGEAVSYCRSKRIKKVKFFQGDTGSLREYTEAFDGVIAGEIIEHLRDDKTAVKRIYRSLKPGGICVVTVPAHRWMWSIIDEYSEHYRRYNKKTLRKIFIDAGFYVDHMFYWGFPTNLLWNFTAYYFVVWQSIHRKAPAPKNSFYRLMTKNQRLVSFFSWIFYPEILFRFMELGNQLLLVAKKK